MAKTARTTKTARTAKTGKSKKLYIDIAWIVIPGIIGFGLAIITIYTN